MKIIMLFLVIVISIGLSGCVVNTLPQETISTDSTKPHTEIILWENCPLSIEGGITGSSYSESINLTVTNLTNNDIDSVKLLIDFIDNGDMSRQISGYYSVETIWANESTRVTISGGNYNFIRASIYPVCVYFKDGSIWGKSSATREEIIENSACFDIEHFALNTTVVYENDISR